MTTLQFHQIAVGSRFRLLACRRGVFYAVGPTWEKIDKSKVRRPSVIAGQGYILCSIAARRTVQPADGARV